MAGAEAITLVTRGSGGAYQIQDLPRAGTLQRDAFEYLVRHQGLNIVGLAGDGVAVNGDNQVVDEHGDVVKAFEPFDLPAPPGPDVDEAELEIAALAAGDGPVEPPKNASTAAWQDYAVSKGADGDEVADLSRDELIDLYGTA